MDTILYTNNSGDLGQTTDHFALINTLGLNLFLLTPVSRTATQVKQKGENQDLSKDLRS